MMTRNNILFKRCAVPKRVELPNDRAFFSKYKRVFLKNLPRNVTIKKKKTIGPHNRRKQKGKGMIGNLFKTGVKLGSRVFNSSIGKKIAEEGIKNVPNIYLAGV